MRLIHFCQEHHRTRCNDAIERIEDALIIKILDNIDTKSQDGKESDCQETYTLIEHINDIRTMSSTLLKHITQICDEELALHLCRTVLLHKNAHEQLSTDEIDQLRAYLANITLFASVGRATAITELLPCDTWTKVMEINRVEPGRLLYSLVERGQYEICYKWLQTEPLQDIIIKSQLNELFLSKIQDSANTQNESFIAICKILLKILVVQMDSKLLLKLKNKQLLQYLVDHLVETSGNENHVYNNYRVTLKIFDVINAKEVDTLWNLVETPLLIIEQCIINSKFDALNKILQAIQPHIKGNECSICKNSTNIDTGGEGSDPIGKNANVDYKDHNISVDCIDHILRIYASKALDFHIGNAHIEIPGNEQISSDSLRSSFIMPREVPAKANWVN